MKEAKWKKLWDEFGKTAYDSLNNLPIYTALLEKTANSLENCGNILDIGCGTGNLAVLLAKKGKTVYCFDNSGEMLSKAREKIKHIGKEERKKVRIKKHDLTEKFPYKDNFFDGISCINVLFNLENPEEVIKESYRVLKKQGLFALSGPLAEMNFSVFQNILQEYKDDKGVKAVLGYNQILKKEGGMPFMPTKNELENILQKHNFKVVIKDRAYLNQSYFFVAKKT